MKETARRTKLTKEEKKLYKARMRRFKNAGTPRGRGLINFFAALTAWALVSKLFGIGKGDQKHEF